MNGIPNESLSSLRMRLEEVGVVDFPFEFWDHDDKVRIRWKMEKVNTAQIDVYVIAYEESNNYVPKHPHLEPSVAFDSVDTTILGLQEQELLEDLNNSTPRPPPTSSKVSGLVDGVDLIISYMKSLL